MYSRKEINDFIAKMPKELKKPKHWRKFVNENSKRYNLIIKHGNEYECTNCGKYFYINEKDTFRFNAKVGQKEFCPFCNNRYLIRNGNLKYHEFRFDLALLDNVNNKIIIRFFEICKYFNYKTRRFRDDIVEYARIVPELKVDLVNERYYKYLWVEKVYHTKKFKKWRVFRGQYGLSQYYDRVYLDNIKEKTKGTIYEYAPIKEAIEYLDNKGINLMEILENAKFSSFELLMKAGLYNLALECPEKFNNKGSFDVRFGISKNYYEFMKKYDVNLKELEVLRIIKVKNIDLIRSLIEKSSNYHYIEEIKSVGKYVKFEKLGEYIKEQNSFSLDIYLDYIENIEKLGIPKTKKILYPDNLQKAHDESVKKVKIIENKETNQKIKLRYKNLSKNIYSNDKFIIRPAKSLADLKDEAKQQNNCVFKNYSEKYALGKTDIYFLRKNNSPDKSLVTVEVYNNKIRQQYQKNNKNVTPQQRTFLKLWEEEVIQKVA